MPQIVIVLHSLLLTEGDRCIRTSPYYAYESMKPHRGATSVATDASKDPLGLSVSALRSGGTLMVTLVNPQHDKAMDVDCALAGVIARGASARILHDDDFNAYNTFSQPDRIVPKNHSASASGGRL
jgi:alpha-N-arabinofuranosidase